MKNRIGFALLFLMGFALGLVIMTNEARAQQPAPASSAATAKQSSANQENGPYTVISSIEVGVRGIAIDGNADKYRSDLNYTPGFRVFDSSLLMKAREGEGIAFDSLSISSFGWGLGGGDHRGNDPNRSLRINAEKSKAYRFDANYRRFDYFNNLRNFALNQHTSDTEYRQGDFDLTLMPNNEKLRINLGYSLSRNSGPSIFTYDYARDEFPIIAPTRYASNEYRVGADAKLGVFDLSFQQGWRFFKDDTTYLITTPQAGNNTINTSVLTTFHRDLPTRGSTPFTRLSAHTFLGKMLDFTGRYIYSSSKTEFSLFETITGRDASGNNITLDRFNITGNAKKPNGMGDIGVTLFVNDRVRISDTFRVNNFRINGGDALLEGLFRTRPTQFGETVLPPVTVDTLSLRTTKYRRFLNLLEGDFDILPRLSLHFGYRFTDRRIELATQDVNNITGVATDPEGEVFTNFTDTFIFGFKAKPARGWSLYFDMERGSSDNVFTRIANYDFTNLRLRSIIRPSSKLSINASFVSRDNTNPSVNIDGKDFGVDVNSRIFTGTVDWTPNQKFYLSSGYNYTHLVSQAEVVFFLPSSVRATGLSRYFMKDNFAFINTYVEMHPRARLYAGYRFHKDPGQEDRVGFPTVLIGSYPYQFQSPEVRLQFKLRSRMDWIAGYQYYDFKEKFVNNQFYQAHLPYTSLRFYFGRRE